jgi:GTPase SAR1 family protein
MNSIYFYNWFILKFHYFTSSNQRPKKLNIPQPKDTQRFKVLVLGDVGVGKSSILERYCSDTFSNTYSATIAVDYKNKLVEQISSNI